MFIWSVMVGVLLLVMVLMVLGWGVSKFSENDREKLSPFECGFDILCGGRVSFSMSFFLIGVVFLIFDVEIVLLLPFPILFNYISGMFWWGFVACFIWILLFGLFLEWGDGALDWV